MTRRPPGLLAVLGIAAATAAGCGAAPIDAVGIDPTSLRRDLLAHWTFDEGSGTAVTDRSGNGHDGQLTGGTWIGAGRFGGALTFAPGEFMTVTDFPQATTSFTVSLWTHVTPAQRIGTQETLLTTENVFAGGWQLHLDDRPGYERFDVAYWVQPLDDYVQLLCRCIETDTWIHLTGVFDGAAERFSFYRGDTLVDHAAMPTPIAPGDPTLYAGRWNMVERELAATLDDVAIWSRALTAEEIAVVSRQPPP